MYNTVLVQTKVDHKSQYANFKEFPILYIRKDVKWIQATLNNEIYIIKSSNRQYLTKNIPLITKKIIQVHRLVFVQE